MYTMLLTALVDLNVAVISGTILVFIANRKFGFNDIEVDFLNEDDGLLAQERTGRDANNGNPVKPGAGVTQER
jgi:hypothetical protein